MNLLPKSHEEFKQQDYWDSFFKKRGNKAFEWYGEYPELCAQLHKYIKPKDDVLIVGCGNSTLGNDMHDIGYTKITSIDVSQVAIRQMKNANKKKRPNMKFIQMDALDMSFENEAFSVVLDKGTLDALMPDDGHETQQQIIKYFNEILRVLKVGGRYVCISLLQTQILEALTAFFPVNNCMFRVVRCYEAEKASNSELMMPIFIIICTKLFKLPVKVLELNLSSLDRMQRCNNELELHQHVKTVQDAAFVCSALKRSSIQDHNDVSFDLYESGGLTTPRYTVYIVDIPPERKNMQYGAFIVPQGREAEWLFSNREGRKHLANSSNSNRLAIITLHRNQEYVDLESVQSELGDMVLNFAPIGLSSKILFLSLGVDVGERLIRFKGHSQFSGDYIIEDIISDKNHFRRLYFTNNQLIIQSEAKLKKSGNEMIVETCFLTCKHHIYMSIGALMSLGRRHVEAPPATPPKHVLVIGLGGGGLCSFLRQFLPDVRITAVDIDKDMLNVATEWFGLSLTNDEMMHVEIMDGLEFLRISAEKGHSFDAILFDVDSKDSSIGMSCPPIEFLQHKTLEYVQQVLTPTTGLFVLNVVLRDSKLRGNIVRDLSAIFKVTASYQLQEDLNEVFVCSSSSAMRKDILQCAFEHAIRSINHFFNKNNLHQSVDLNQFITSLHINEYK